MKWLCFFTQDPRSTGFMKKVGDKLLKCPPNVCRNSDIDVCLQTVLNKENSVCLIVRFLYYRFTIGFQNIKLLYYNIYFTDHRCRK